MNPPLKPGDQVTHRNSSEKVGEVTSINDGVAVVGYTHTDDAGQPFTTQGHYALAELTLVP